MSNPVPLRIIVADDQASVREGLVVLLGLLPDIDVVAAAANGQQALDLVAEHHPDAILLDLHMPVLDGIETTRRLSAEHPEVVVVILTTYSDDTSVLAALRAGARSYLTKDADRADIAQALHSAANGLTVLDPAVHAILLNAAARAGVPDPVNGTGPDADPDSANAAGQGVRDAASTDPGSALSAEPGASSPAGPGSARRGELPDGLTPREGEILTLIASGATNTEIADRLVLSHHTVKSHINRVFAKTGSRDRAAAMRYAQQHGLG